MDKFSFVSLFSICLKLSTAEMPCAPQMFESDSFVCVCNISYCDSLPRIQKIAWDMVHVFTSSQGGLRFDYSEVPIASEEQKGSDHVLTIEPSEVYQRILGFGGAFTDSAVANIRKLKQALQLTLLEAYFSRGGLAYTMGRVPIGSSDFSYMPYSYDRFRNDYNLARFALKAEDLRGKIPLIKQASEIAGVPLNLVASSWAAPAWMKTDNRIQSGGRIKKGDYDVFARYLVRFLKAYEEHGVKFWAITTGNEPENGYLSTRFSPEELGEWINYLGPHLKSSYASTKLLLLDGFPDVVPAYSKVLDNKTTASYIDGWALHPYTSVNTFEDALKFIRSRSANLSVLSTEYCIVSARSSAVMLGSWARGEQYAIRIIKSLNNWSIAWIDWNLALDQEGGPNWINVEVDSPIIVVNPDLFYKQPMFYTQAHFSRFFLPGSLRIKVNIEPDEGMHVTGIITKENVIVAVILNQMSDTKNVTLKLRTSKYSTITMPPKSIVTITYRKDGMEDTTYPPSTVKKR